jgi:type VI secretion system protein ImpL
MSSLGLIEDREVLPGTNKGFFLKDFFSKILPKDRRMFTPTQRTLQWGRLTRNLGLTSWMAIVIALCGLLSFSFVKNLNTLRNAAADFTPPPALKGEIFADLATMERFSQGILNIEESNNRWWIPRFWLTESIEVEKKIKEKYCTQFRDGFLVSFDKHMAEHLADFSIVTPDGDIGRHAAHLVRRINLLRARLEGKSLKILGEKPQPSFNKIVVSADRQIFPELQERFHGFYLYSLLWREDKSHLKQEMNTLQGRLKHLLNLRPDEMHWIVGWMNEDSGLSDILLQDFWGGSLSFPAQLLINGESDENKRENPLIGSGLMVHRAFTSEGKELIESFIQEMEEALPDSTLIRRKAEFERWYKQVYLNEWYEFGKKFPEGINYLDGKKEWQQVASIIATDKSPYFALLDKIDEELKPFRREFVQDKDQSVWADLVYEFQSARTQLEENKTGTGSWSFKDSAIVKSATRKVQSKINKIEQENEFKEFPEESDYTQSRMISVNAFEQYKDALEKLTPVAYSRQMAFQQMGSVFGEDPVGNTSPFFMAQNAIQSMKAAMTGNRTEQPVFWNLITGPWDFLLEYCAQEASCQIKDLWEENVLVEVQGISDTNSMAYLLLGQDGLAVKFIGGPAKPFVSRSLSRGYYSKEALGKKISFESSFLNFMTQGSLAVQPKRIEIEPKPVEPVPTRIEPVQIVPANYSVSIKGLPTDTNLEAQIIPHATNLHIKCANQDFTMVNYNFPVQKTIDWSPNTCGNVDFSIEVGNLVLSKKYTGADAFPKFLIDFSQGTSIFYPKDFPTNQTSLERLGISYIKVNYQFKNHEPVLEMFRNKERQARIEAMQAKSEDKKVKSEEKHVRIPRLPRNIAPCWDR